MDELDYISAPLQRKLKPGKQYGKLLPYSDCSSVSLGNGKNNTMDGVVFMAEWVDRYKHQTEKLAKKLQGKTVFETVNNIYGFLYHHIQYKVDGQLQQLRSPACAWKQRYTGVDCKSYTIFAMCLLRNMGITAAIRQVRQPGSNADLWTHVYAVVPIDQRSTNFPKDLKDKGKYLVIDATRHVNEEVDFLESKDKIMQSHQYVGLAAPSMSFVGRGKVGKAAAQTTKKTATTDPIIEGWENFKHFLESLQKQGVSVAVLKELTAYLKSLLNRGINPYMEFTRDGLKISEKKGAPARFFAIKPQPGMNGWLDDLFSGSDSGNGGNGGNGGSEGGDDDGSGFDWGALWGSVKGWFTDVSLNKHISCWGDSAYGESQIKSDMNKFKSIIQGFENRINQAGQNKNWPQLSTAFNELFCVLKLTKGIYLFNANKSWRSHCTRDNLGAFVGIVDQAIARFGQYSNEVEKVMNVTSSGNVTTTFKDHLTGMWATGQKDWHTTCPGKNYTPKQPNVSIPVLDNPSDHISGGSNNGGNFSGGGGSVITAPVQSQTKTAGMGMIPMLLLIGGTMLAWPSISKAIKAAPAKKATSKTTKQ